MKAEHQPDAGNRQLRGALGLPSRQFLFRILLVLLVSAPFARAQSNSEFSVRISDGLNRPVPGVTVDVYRRQKSADGQEQKIELGRALSDTNGIARGFYDKSSIPTNESFSVALSKDGYAGYDAGPQVNYLS